jgi:hypothetical protein
MTFHILIPGHPQVEDTRNAHLAALAATYEGWSVDLARRHDPQSVWFGIKEGDHDGFQATCRLRFNTSRNQRISSEKEELHPRICEASGLSYRSTFHLLNLLHAQGQWMIANRVGNCYAQFDSSDRFLKRFSTEVLGFVPLSGATIPFSNFRSRAPSRPVSFQLHMLTPKNLLLGVSRMSRMGATLRFDNRPEGEASLRWADESRSRFERSRRFGLGSC